MYYIGIDIGGTHIKIGFVDENLTIIYKAVIPFSRGSAENVVEEISNTINQILKNKKLCESNIVSIGIVVPGSIDKHEKLVIDAHNLGFHNVPLHSLFARKFPKQAIYIANDANGAALAELYKGAFLGCKTAVLLTLGTGVGGGIILNGKMFNGGMNQGVELGHIFLVNGGSACTCGNHGCMESYCSASALARAAVIAMQKAPKSLLASRTNRDSNLVDAKLVIECAKDGDEAAKRVFDEYVDHLGSACASIFNLLDPEVLAIGGGLCGAGEFLFEPLRSNVAKKCFYKTHGRIVPAKMGNDAGIIGAAMLQKNATKQLHQEL